VIIEKDENKVIKAAAVAAALAIIDNPFSQSAMASIYSEFESLSTLTTLSLVDTNKNPSLVDSNEESDHDKLLKNLYTLAQFNVVPDGVWNVLKNNLVYWDTDKNES
jgi:hypothetical protein